MYTTGLGLRPNPCDSSTQSFVALQILSAESCVFLILAVTCFLTGQMETLNYGGSEWLVKSDAATKRWYASERVAELASSFWSSDDFASSSFSGIAASTVQPVRSQPGYSVVFMYNTEEPNLFTPEILESIQQVWPTTFMGNINLRRIYDLVLSSRWRTFYFLIQGTPSSARFSW